MYLYIVSALPVVPADPAQGLMTGNGDDDTQKVASIASLKDMTLTGMSSIAARVLFIDWNKCHDSAAMRRGVANKCSTHIDSHFSSSKFLGV